MIASPTDFVLVSVAHGPVELSATTTPIDLRWRREMETVKIEIELTVQCVCGTELRQVALNGKIVTVTPCAFCQSEARTQAYDKGLRIGMMGDRLRDAS